MYQALYRKYRPKKFDDVVGQDIVIKTLKNAVIKEKISHAYLFAGPRGCGKTTIAKIFARLVNCKNPQNGSCCEKCVCCTQTDEQNMDIIEMDAASNNGVDEIREINNKVKLAPTLGKYKIYIIDEVHMLTIGAFNALLKTLEEPPSHVIFILATTDPQKVPITILSRCQRFDLKKISYEKIEKRLQYICEKENIKIEANALKEIARLGDGCLRDSIGILDQVISYSDDKVTLNDIYEVNGTISQNDVYELLLNVKNNNLEKIINKISELSGNGKSIIKITEEILLFLRNTILSNTMPEYKQKNYTDISSYFSNLQLLECIKIFNESLLGMKKFSNTKMLLELAFIKIISSFNSSELNEKQHIKKEQINEELCEETKEKTKEETKEEVKEIKEDTTPIKNTKIMGTNFSKESSLAINESSIAVKNNERSKININNDELQQKLKKFVDTRVNNTLANFDKKKTLEERNEIKNLVNYVMDEKYNIYVTMLLDGELKAVGNDYIIFSYATSNLSNLFNENIIKLEETLNELLNINYKLVAVDINSWNDIKEEFNHKLKKFEYEEETININELLSSFNKEKDDMKSLFGDIVEYN